MSTDRLDHLSTKSSLKTGLKRRGLLRSLQHKGACVGATRSPRGLLQTHRNRPGRHGVTGGAGGGAASKKWGDACWGSLENSRKW